MSRGFLIGVINFAVQIFFLSYQMWKWEMFIYIVYIDEENSKGIFLSASKNVSIWLSFVNIFALMFLLQCCYPKLLFSHACCNPIKCEVNMHLITPMNNLSDLSQGFLFKYKLSLIKFGTGFQYTFTMFFVKKHKYLQHSYALDRI